MNVNEKSLSSTANFLEIYCLKRPNIPKLFGPVGICFDFLFAEICSNFMIFCDLLYFLHFICGRKCAMFVRTCLVHFFCLNKIYWREYFMREYFNHVTNIARTIVKSFPCKLNRMRLVAKFWGIDCVLMLCAGIQKEGIRRFLWCFVLSTGNLVDIPCQIQ